MVMRMRTWSFHNSTNSPMRHRTNRDSSRPQVLIDMAIIKLSGYHPVPAEGDECEHCGSKGQAHSTSLPRDWLALVVIIVVLATTFIAGLSLSTRRNWLFRTDLESPAFLRGSEFGVSAMIDFSRRKAKSHRYRCSSGRG